MKRVIVMVAIIALAFKAPLVAGILAFLLVVINLIVEEADRHRRVTVELLAPREAYPTDRPLHTWES